MTPLARLRWGAVVLAGTCLTGVAGYMWAGHSLLESIYLVVVTVSTVGSREPVGIDAHPGVAVLTIALILVGMTAAFFTIGGLLQMLTEGEIQAALDARQQSREIAGLSKHVVVCGYGRVGQILVDELAGHNQRVVVIDRDQQRVDVARALGYLVLLGDATEEEVLKLAGMERAKVLVTVLPNDAANVFITLTARDLHRELKIIARGEMPSTRKKLLQAGANQVVLPAAIGAMQMTQMIVRPTAFELMEQVAGRTSLDVQIADVDVHLDELQVPAGSPLVGQSPRSAEIRQRQGLIVVAVKSSDGQLSFNPDADIQFADGTTVVVMGPPDRIAQFEQQFGLVRPAD